MKTRSLLGLGLAALVINGCKTNKPLVQQERFSNSSINVAYMDNSISPKEDFFLFANGSWIKENEIPNSESRWGSFNELDQDNKLKIEALLDSLSQGVHSKGSGNQIIGDYYTSFLNMSERNSFGTEPILKLFKQIDALINKVELTSLIAEFHNQGISALFGFGVGQDLKNVEEHTVYLNQGGIGLPNRDYYLEENKQEILAKYKEHVQKCFDLIYQDSLKSSKQCQGVLEIEMALANSMMKPAEMRKPEKIYNKRSIVQLSEMAKKFEWNRYFEIREVASFDTLIVGNPSYIEKIDNLIESNDLDTWKAYLKWGVFRNFAPHLNQQCVDLHFDFYGKVLSGKKEQKSLKHQVIEELTGSYISEVLGKVFVERYFSKEAKDKVNDMVDNLMVVFEERIQNLDWMSKDTKKEAIKKLKAIDRKLGYPDQWKTFDNIEISSSSYFGNVQSLNRAEIRENIEKLDKKVDKSEWGMPAHLVNAYYSPLNNEIAFPAGIMQSPFFDENAEDAVNYGRIGMVIGHEFTHGFDDMGSKFSFDGNFVNWWTEEDRQKFEAKTKILGETFSSFCVSEGNCVNADLTMGENIADLGGLTLAFHAYMRTDEFKSQNTREGFSPAQRFFIAYAQLWKIMYRQEELLKRLATDPHSPGMYRVNGPLKNCPEFFEAFDVKKGSKMRNSNEKISKIW